MNYIAVDGALHSCPSKDEFFQAVNKIDLTPLEAVISGPPATAGQTRSEVPAAGADTFDGEISQNPHGNGQPGPKVKPAKPFVVLRLFSLYPGTGAPPRLGTLHKLLKQRDNDLAERCGFTGRLPDRGTIRKRFLKLDRHPRLINEALREISPKFVQLYLIPPDPGPPPKQDDSIHHSRTAECNKTRRRILQDGVGDDEFDDLFPRGCGAVNFILRHVYGGQITCHKCRPWDCRQGHDHGLTERPPRVLKCPRKAGHKDGCVHEVHRQWRCRCCGSNVSVTSGIPSLHGVGLPLRTVLRCIHVMLNQAHGVSALRMGTRLNTGGRTMRHGTMLQLTHRIRKAMQEPHPLPFKGTVEIDEAKVKLKDGEVHLIGAYDHATRRVYIEILDGPTDQKVMRDFVERVSLPKSRVYTDGTAAWPPNIDRIHGVVIHKDFDFGHAAELYGEGNGWYYITTNRIEGSWGLLRSALRIPGTASCKYFPLYLAEVMWRINHISNRLEAESYKGEERRIAALMGQLVASMGNRRLNIDELQEGNRTGSNRSAAGPLFSREPMAPDHNPLDVGDMPLAA